jgi:hypothetical protein
MDKLQKFEYIQSIESYFEDNQVYELLENLLKQLVINRPEKPLDFLIERLQKPESKISVILTSNSQENFHNGTPWLQQEAEHPGPR